ncbi:hypothetical protein ACP275_01G118700 [Erythranthe tilingii]
MANLRTVMDDTFWDMNISTPQALDGASKAVLGDPIPIDGGRASKALSIQQLSLLGTVFLWESFRRFLLRRITRSSALLRCCLLLERGRSRIARSSPN